MKNSCTTCKYEYCGVYDEPCVGCKFNIPPNSPEYNDAPVLWWPVDDNKSTNDPVNCPSHYTDGKIEVIEYIEDKKLGFCLGNAIKYISRAGKKDPDKTIQDLRKAIWYIERRIKEIEEGLCGA